MCRIALLSAVLALAACGQAPGAGAPVDGGARGTSAAPPNAAACAERVPGPAAPPAGAIPVDPAIAGDLSARTRAAPAGSTFWLAPGTHRLGPDRFDQVAVKDDNTYLGAPGAVLDGQGRNQYAFTTPASGVTIRHLTVRGFVAPHDEGVVNHDSGNAWVLEHNVIEGNQGAGLMAGAHQRMRHNCLRHNGQYGLNAYQSGNGITGLLLEGNEITGNNTDDWEKRSPGCGCTGGMKFWSVNGADIRDNWIHDNRGAGIWADTNNNDFLIEGNLIERNDAEAVFYETSYNLVMRRNIIRGNAFVQGRDYARRGDDFPIGSVYLSESGGEPRISARTDFIDISENLFEDNWSGITAWENADRFCNSAANTSTGSCTLLVPQVSTCSQPEIVSQPLYADCRWRTQRVRVHHNTFSRTGSATGCFANRMAILSNYGTYPSWSPYRGEVVQQAITLRQDVRWRDNSYTGPWAFVLASTGATYTAAQWRAGPYLQDQGSTFSDDTPAPC